MTYSAEFYIEYKEDIIKQIKLDNVRNGDCASLVCIDPSNESLDVVIKTFNLELVLAIMDIFSSKASRDSRMWLHQRAATGLDVHVGTAHGFNDRSGNIIMHNGILSAGRGAMYTVDSFCLSDLTDTSSADRMLSGLIRLRESFANIFIIRPKDYTFGVVRMSVGSLYTDNNGNYSTHPVAGVCSPVEMLTATEYSFGKRRPSYNWPIAEYKKFESSATTHDGVLSAPCHDFQVGDRVRIDSYSAYKDGKIGTVIEYVDEIYVKVKLDESTMTASGDIIDEVRVDVFDLELVS
jgi:hypothetical protein